MKKIRVVYFGTPDYSANLLEYLFRLQEASNYEIVAVVTQEPKIVGRNKILTPSAVNVVSDSHKAPIYTNKIKENTSEIVQLFKKLEVDIGILFAYGQIIPLDVIESIRYGIWNIHPSSLPLFRGASPIAYPVALGLEKSEVSIMQMDDRLDHGDIISKIPIDISVGLASDIIQHIPEIVGPKLIELMSALPNGIIKRDPQSHEDATFTKTFSRNDGYIDEQFVKLALLNHEIPSQLVPKWFIEYAQKYLFEFKMSSGTLLFNLWRAMHPWPGIWTQIIINGKQRRIKLIELQMTESKLRITKIQAEGGQIVENTLWK